MEDEIKVNEATKDWTKEELFELLKGLKIFGSQSVNLISENIPTKTVEQIGQAIDYYKSKARKIKTNRNTTKKRNWRDRRESGQPPVPLASWARFLNESMSFKELHTETSNALRLIAEFDNIPSAVDTSGIDFKNIYHSLANAMEGKAIPENTPLAIIFNKCIVDTALSSKAFIRSGTLQDLIQWIDVTDKEIKVLPRPTVNAELSTLKHLASQRAYNPLGITEEFLRPT